MLSLVITNLVCLFLFCYRIEVCYSAGTIYNSILKYYLYLRVNIACINTL